MATKRDDDELRAMLRAVPQRIVGQMCGGRQTVHLQRVADRWGFPIDGKTVDLFAVMARLWSFLKQYGPMLAVLMEDTGDGDENALGVRYLRAKIQKTEADALAAELRNAQKEGMLCDRSQVHEAFGRIASAFQDASRKAQLKWGQDGFDFFVALADKMEADVMPLFVDDIPNADTAEANECSAKSA